MAIISQTSIGINNNAVNQINRKIQIRDTGSLQIQNNGGFIRILSPITSSVQGMVITTGQVQILGI